MTKADSGKTLLVVDDDPVFCRNLSHHFTGSGLHVFTAGTGKEALNICSGRRIDVVLLDQKLPDIHGASLCASLLSSNEQCKIIFVTAYPSFDNAVSAVKTGAYDYISKPFEMDELEMAVDRALRTLSLEQVEEIQQYKTQKEREGLSFIGAHGGTDDIRKLIRLAGSNDAPALITGETGVGKSLVAKMIHFSADNRQAPFMNINCAALPENLIESELFGYEKGAFTGATAPKKGIFEMADGGTLLLDEIGLLPLHLQAKLLGVLDDKKIRRLGGNEVARPVFIRILASTNVDIEKAVQENRFREDLYYRLGVLRIHVPPLRERIHDIPPLCHHFVRQLAREQDVRLPDGETEKLKQYHWPGNVRELKNIIERAVILRKDNSLRPSELLGNPGNPTLSGPEPVYEPDGGQFHLYDGNPGLPGIAEMEKRLMRFTLDAFSGNRSRAAQSLGISRATLLRKIKTYGL